MKNSLPNTLVFTLLTLLYYLHSAFPEKHSLPTSTHALLLIFELSIALNPLSPTP